tara:strand:+ start:1537 stop:1668 length:132 start_codon:yes stop_codon:yes gene_type:complete
MVKVNKKKFTKKEIEVAKILINIKKPRIRKIKFVFNKKSNYLQ